MAEVGKRGFETTVARHWQGDRKAYRDHLRLRRHEQQIESLVEKELSRRLEAEEKVVCEEMPALSGPDEDVPW